MNPVVTPIVLAFALTALPVGADEETVPAPPEAAEAVPTPPAPPESRDLAQRLDDLQARLDELEQADDPADRQRLLGGFRQRMSELRGMVQGGRHGMTAGSAMPSMHEHMQQMQQRMQAMMATDDPQRRRELMAEQHRQMHAMMAPMHQRHHGGHRMMAPDAAGTADTDDINDMDETGGLGPMRGRDDMRGGRGMPGMKGMPGERSMTRSGRGTRQQWMLAAFRQLEKRIDRLEALLLDND